MKKEEKIDTHHQDIDEKQDDSCCQDKQEEQHMVDKLSHINTSKNVSNFLIGAVVIVVLLNTMVMSFFSITVQNKLNHVIELSEPQVGELVLITPEDCTLCGDMSTQKNAILGQNIELSDDNIYTVTSDKAQELIKKFELTKLPALIFTSEEKINTQLAKTLEKSSVKSGEDFVIWESAQMPYFDINKNAVQGLVDVIYISDKSCSTCYDVVQAQQPILRRFGVAMASERRVDVSDDIGKELIKQYNIYAVPTVILSKEARNYDALAQVWQQVGSIESDGSFVFREMKALQTTYKDLNTQKIVDFVVEEKI